MFSPLFSYNFPVEISSLLISIFNFLKNNIPLIVSIIAIIVSGVALYKAIKTKKFDLYLEILKSYNSPQMLIALRAVWNFIDECKKDPDIIVTSYKDYLKQDNHPLHGHRRMVSTLFQQLAFLRYNRLIPFKFRKLPNLDLSIIEFLYYIEEEAIPVSRKRPEPISEETRPTPAGTKPVAKTSKLMYRMYNEWLRKISK